jgi:hypothetical protein
MLPDVDYLYSGKDGPVRAVLFALLRNRSIMGLGRRGGCVWICFSGGSREDTRYLPYECVVW